VVATLMLLLAGCGPSGPGSAAGGGRPVVLTTFTVLQDIAQNVAGDHIRVESITKPGAEIHGYEPTPGDVAKASEADLILDNGLHLEAWFAQFVETADVPHAVVSDGIEALDIAGSPGTPNPHAWMSPEAAQVYVENMVTAFSELDPEHSGDYERNGEAYSRQLQQIHDELVETVGSLPQNERALVTCEGAFSYLARDVGLEEHYIWPVNAEQQATPQQIAAVIETVRDQDVPAVFCESTVSDAPLQQVVEATGARFGGTLYVDSLSEEGGPVPSYLALLRHDADVIVEGLTGTEAAA
jgi:manganese transport system substrate-binding protein